MAIESGQIIKTHGLYPPDPWTLNQSRDVAAGRGPSPIETQLQQAHQAIALLQERIQELQRRLEPVSLLSPARANDVNEKQPPPAPPRSQVEESIYTLRVQMELMSDVVGAMTKALTV